ncbi:MAG: S1 RNA-binding domain-containing protein [Lachnospiraceae bacterium]
MLKLGEKQRLSIIKTEPFGVYLAEFMPKKGENLSDVEKVLLPIKQVPKDFGIGDSLEVFLYKDSKDRLIATVHEPAMTLGQIARLKVAQTSKIGAFLSWGLEKDLFLPFKEQTRKVEAGDEIPVALYIDKSSRLAATMRLYPYLSIAKGYEKDDIVTGTVYEIAPNFGAYVAVDDQYQSMIPQKELTKKLSVGERIEARVIAVKEDGKLDLSLREKSYMQMTPDGEKIMELLAANGGKLPVGDKSSPEEIKELLQMSKNEFKRAAGHLYKERKVIISDKEIRIKKD